MVELNVDALRVGKYHGVQYQKIKTFLRNKKKAMNFADRLEEKIRSRRAKPVIEEIPIGLGLGMAYRVCIPENLDKKKLKKEVC